MKIRAGLTAIIITLALFSGPARAQSAEDFHPFLTDKFNLGIGFYHPTKSLTLRVDGTEPEEEIDFDEAFKFSNSL